MQTIGYRHITIKLYLQKKKKSGLTDEVYLLHLNKQGVGKGDRFPTMDEQMKTQKCSHVRSTGREAKVKMNTVFLSQEK